MIETLSIAFFPVEHISSIWSNRLKITKRHRKQSPRSVETLQTRNFSHTGRMRCGKDLGIQFDDIKQEARFRLWRAIEAEREINFHASYIYRIVVSVTINYNIGS